MGEHCRVKILFAESHDLDYQDPLGSHQYIRLFHADGHSCLWLGPAISPLHLFKADRVNRHRFKVWKEGIRKVEGIDWHIPLTLMPYYNLPLLRSRYAGRSHYRYCLPPVKQSLRQAGFGEVDILWCAGPVAVSLLELIPHRVSCFRLADRFDQFSRIPQSVVALQEELIAKADVVLATSRELCEYARRIKQDAVFYLPNGVSEFFFRDCGPAPADFPAGFKKVAVFVGTIDAWFDCELLEYAADKMEDFHFLLIGAVKDKITVRRLARLSLKKNFTLLGRREHAAVPQYLRAATVGIIPFQLTPLTHAINPIKYFEYLACGLPVVASPMRELLALGGALETYTDAPGFCRALRRAAEKKTEISAGLIEYAGAHTWQERYAQVKRILEERF